MNNVKLIDELFEMYRTKLTGDEEDIDILAFAVLEQLDRNEILSMINELDEQEIKDLMGLYLIETLKGKFAKEDMTHSKHYPYNVQRNFH